MSREIAGVLIEAAGAVDANGDAQDGRVWLRSSSPASFGDAAAEGAQAAGAEVVRLPNQVLLPAFANAHSHAFQRMLRGRVEQRSVAHPDDDFWSWRSLMYDAALQLSPDGFEAIAAWCYLDMVRSGCAVVGEFHYVHHDVDGSPYDDGTTLSQRLADAAGHVGLDLVLLNTAYERAGVGRAPDVKQRRFIFADVDAFLQHARHVRDAVTGAHIAHGLALHSVRACSSTWRQAVADEAKAHQLPLHVHACEQTAELDEVQAAYGKGPLQVLDDDGALFASTAVVHATHIDDDDIALFARRQAQVVLCPSTERNLGDGMCPIADLVDAGVRLSVGTDSHARIDLVDEVRSLEDHERLRLRRRNVLPQPGKSLRHALVHPGSVGGHVALGRRGHGSWMGIDLGPTGEAYGPAAAVDAFLVGGSGGDVNHLWVRGRRVVDDKRVVDVDEDAVVQRAVDVMRSLATS